METIKTRAYGEIQVPEDSVIMFKREILGFEGFKNYYLLEMKDLPNFYWLQSKEEPQLAFVVVDPRIFKEDYELDIDMIDVNLLELESETDVLDFVIANIPDDPAQMTLNLLGPVVINTKKRIAIQAISQKNDYDTKYLAFQKVAEKAEKKEG